MSEKYYYSPSSNNFYPESLKPDYYSAGSWPSDGTEVSEAVIVEFAASPNLAGKVRGANSTGVPVWIDPPPPTAGQLNASRLADAWSAYNIASSKILAIQQQIDDADYDEIETEESLIAKKVLWSDYRRRVRSYLKTDGSDELPATPE